MSLIVRAAVEEDARTIASFALKLFAQHREFDPERFADIGNIDGAEHYYRSRIEAAEATVLVAERGGRVIGFAYLEFEKLDYAMLLENAALLHDIYVDESARGGGAGKALLEGVKQAARALGAEKLVLSAAAKNEHARDFFMKSGFRETMVEMTLGLGR